jgi:Fe-S-cluster-containing hydrogenase component 2
MTQPKLLLCDCLNSQAVDAEQIERATGLTCGKIYTEMCRKEAAAAAEALREGEVIIACGQERQAFEDLAAEIEADPPLCVDIRDRAGWTGDAADAAPKMAALLAEAILPAPGAKVVDVPSEGTCLILGEPEAALSAATHLCDILSVTVLLDPEAESPLADDRRFDIVRGRVGTVTGALGGFSLTFDALQERIPGGRGTFAWTAPRSGGRTECDILLDLRRAPALVPAPEKREGYLRADPGSADAITKALLTASQLVGTFEKPLYVRLDEELCAHSRARKTGCTRCLDLCPTGAISPSGDHVSVDAMVCAGCGSCSAACPSGAIAYDAPPVSHTFQRLQTLAATWRKLSKDAPRLLVHDGSHGAEMIRLSARYGRGLPADVIPMELDALASFGHAEMIAALGCGFAEVTLLLSPQTEADGLPLQADLANALGGGGTVRLIEPGDPDRLEEALYEASEFTPAHQPILPLGSRRQVTRLAAKSLNPPDAVVPLPKGAPYGSLLPWTRTPAHCASPVCRCARPARSRKIPTARNCASRKTPACNAASAPPSARRKRSILDPRLNLGDDALRPRVLKEEEPFHCIECGKPFGVRSTVERMTEKLAGKHAMFQDNKAVRLIQMCDDCRVNAVYHSENNPFAMGERPRVRTTDDYISKRRDH